MRSLFTIRYTIALFIGFKDGVMHILRMATLTIGKICNKFDSTEACILDHRAQTRQTETPPGYVIMTAMILQVF